MKHQVYPYPNKSLVKALYLALQAKQISLGEFACCLKESVMGQHRQEPQQ